MAERLTTTDAHFEAFTHQQERRFKDELLTYLRREYPDALDRRDDAWVLDLIDLGIQQARQYDIVLEADVTRFVELMLALSPDFDESSKTSWAREILTDSALRADQKLDRIYEFVIFWQERKHAGANSSRTAPRPFHCEAVQKADEEFQATHPNMDRRRITMGPSARPYREAWMAQYQQALAELNVSSATSRPDAEVGDPVTAHPQSYLTVMLVDGETGRPIGGASVQASGPTTAYAVTNPSGEAHFESLATGEYRIFGLDVQQRSCQAMVTLPKGRTRMRIACRRASGLPQEA